VLLRDDRRAGQAPGFDLDLRAPNSHVVPHRRVTDIGVVLVDEPVPDPCRRVTLLARRGQIFPQHLADHRLERAELRRDALGDLPRRWHRGHQRLPHRVPADAIPGGKLPRS
jgi:hypothetical protein